MEVEKTAELETESPAIEDCDNQEEKTENGSKNEVDLVDERFVDSEKIQEAINKHSGPEYEYLNRGYTSEIFKIEIGNLPKHYGIGEMKKLFKTKLALDASKIKIPRPNSKFGFVCFRNLEEKTKAMAILNGYVWKGSTLTCTEAKASKDPFAKRKIDGTDEAKQPHKKAKTVEETSAPLGHLPYEEQLKIKQEKMVEILKKFQDSIYKLIPEQRIEIFAQRELNHLPCVLEDIVPSPEIIGYRNKCEFSIGKDKSGEIAVGNRFGSYSDGSVEVGSIQNLKFVPDRMKLATELFRKFVIQSKMDPYNHETYEGYYRQFTCRYQRNGELMLIVGIHPQKFTDAEKQKFQQDLVDFFTTGHGKELDITSLYYEEIQKRVPGQKSNVIKHLHGTTHITETILDLKFRISPTSFFQGNTLAAEKLYQSAIDLAKPTEESIVLDICCGTGTVGLCFAKYCKKVLGVEIIPQAIEDAKHNAKENGIENCGFHCGNADDMISYLIREANSITESGKREYLAIVDPPRAGLR
jgi:tRNA (uracil-5-)-methyltransferase